MAFRLSKLLAALVLMAAMWALDGVGRSDPQPWVQPAGSAAHVRITQFYATAGMIHPGEKTKLCYGVANAKSVRISPLIAGVYPSARRCLDVGPEHTTHYTIQAIGYDGTVAMRSLTLPVTDPPGAPLQTLHIASSDASCEDGPCGKEVRRQEPFPGT